MNHHSLISGSLALLLAGGLSACSVFEASPAAATGYNPSTAPVATRAAFLQHTWVAGEYRRRPIRDNFSSVYIAPVNTDYMATQTWWRQQSGRRDQLESDTRSLARRIRGQFQGAVRNYRGNSIPLAAAPGPGVLVIELALTELVPSKAYWNAGAAAAGFVVPGAGFLSAAGRGSIAIEGRLRDGATNQIIATFADRRADKTAPVNMGGYRWYHGAEENIADWAAEFAEFLNTPPDHVVSRHSAVRLKPW